MQYLKFAVAALAGYVAVLVRDALVAGSTPALLAGPLAALAAAAAYAAANLALIELPMRLALTRRLFDDSYKFVGDWIETVSKGDARFYSIMSIYFSYATNKYVASGVASDNQGALHATFDSDHVTPRSDVNQVFFTYTFVLFEPQPLEGRGATFLTFDSARNGAAPCFGNGYFLDFTGPPVRGQIRIDRVPRTLANELIGKPTLATNDDRVRFVRAYHQKYGAPSSTNADLPHKDEHAQ